MAKVINRFSARDVAALVKAAAERTEGGKKIKPQLLPDGAGLYLQIGSTGGASWSLKYMLDGKARQMGLGPYPTLLLADARERARQAKQKLLDGIDPISARAAERSARRAKITMTFKQAAAKTIAKQAPNWRSAKHSQQWTSSLETYAYPIIGDMDVADIGLPHIEKILEPIWGTKLQTAVRLLNRIEIILDWATAGKLRSGDNPARWEGNLEHRLTKPKAEVKHLAAMAYADVPAFVQSLRLIDTIPARALELTILTAARSGEIMGALPVEFDLENAIWTIPGERMKSGKPHRVPLCDRAVTILREAKRIKGNPLMFPASKGGGRMSTDSMLDLVKVAGPALTVHGFRSAFRSWGSGATNFQHEVLERALAHTIKDKVVRAYDRDDLLDKRKLLMDAWSDFLDAPPVVDGSNVVPMKVA